MVDFLLLSDFSHLAFQVHVPLLYAITMRIPSDNPHKVKMSEDEEDENLLCAAY